jgi:glycosyltransferase involved in cell wall biosynthesis
MKVLHLAAGNRWTGAAAPAFAEVEALRMAGVDAHYAYVGGYKLEAKLKGIAFAHPIIEKQQNPWAFARSVRAIRKLIREHGIDIVHAHLTYDHWLARVAVRGRGVSTARTFHSRRVIRRDPFTRALIGATAALFVANDTFRDVLPRAAFTPPPVDHRQFHPHGPNVRALYGLRDDEPLVTAIGKLSAGRGFEDVLRTYQNLRRELPAARLMIIGHGEHRPALEQLASELAIADGVIWAGYHEDDLAEHYRAADLLLFTARGSDEGHRAVLEAMACGVPPAVFPIEGVHALLGDLPLIADTPDPARLASLAASLLRGDLPSLRARVAGRSQELGYPRAAERLLAGYEQAAPFGK